MQHKSEYLDLRLCDNMQLMAQYPDKYFELAICDPPYGIGAVNKTSHLKNSLTKYIAKIWDNATPDKEYFDELLRVSKHQIIWGGNYFAHLLPPAKKWIVWNKVQAEGMDQAMHELAWQSQDNKQAAIFTKSIQSSCNKVANNKHKAKQYMKIHPTQKPVALYKWLLDKYAKAGDKILDTHLGSGSIAIACHDYKYHLTACELDSDYFAAMQTRIENHLKQTTILF